MIFYKGTLISFMFFGDRNIGVVFWSNGTISPLMQFVSTNDKNEGNFILTDSGKILAMHEKIIYMARN